jgi:hypothetical protein
VDWTTKQKLLVSFNLPITPETIKIELMDRIDFKDAIITPEDGEYGKGFVVGVQVDPKKYVIKCSIMFEPDFMIRRSQGGGEIIESGMSIVDIYESGDADTDIVEG